MTRKIHLAYPVTEVETDRALVACAHMPEGQRWERTTDHSKVTCMNCRCTDIFKETAPNDPPA